MNQDDIRGLFADWRKKHERPAWRPITTGEPSAGSSSWFGGRPLLSSSDPWPACSQCRAPMRFFLQLGLSDLPDALDVPAREGCCSCSTARRTTAAATSPTVAATRASSRSAGSVAEPGRTDGHFFSTDQ